MSKREKKYVLSLVMDNSRSDVNFFDHETKEDEFGHTVVVLSKKEREDFLQLNDLTIQSQYSEQMDDIINHICRGDIAYGQAWNSEVHKEIWTKRHAHAW